MGDFYVYEHWRPDKNTCFWVGKGCGRRAYNFKRNARYNRVVAKLANAGLSVDVRIVASSLEELDAHNVECDRIAFWRSSGSIDLCNMTVGGEGVSGLRHSEASKVLMASKATGRIASSETREKMRISQTGRRHSQETRDKLAAIKLGKKQGPHTPEHCAKIGAAHRGRKDTDDVREKKRLAALNRNSQTEEVRNRIAEKVRNLWADPEYRARMVAAHRNRAAPSDEAKENMRLAQRARRELEQGAR